MSLSLSKTQARDEILGLISAAWSEHAPTYPIFWDDLPGDKPVSGPYARAVVRHIDGGQRTLGGIGNRRFSRNGVVIVQIFTPRGMGLADSDLLSKIAVDAYEGQRTAGGVWFRDVRAIEITGEAGLLQVNVLADFTYDEMK